MWLPGTLGSPRAKRLRLSPQRLRREPQPLEMTVSPAVPIVDDIGRPMVADASFDGSNVKLNEIPPLFEGMRPSLKPCFVDVELLRRTVPATNKKVKLKAKYKGLPPKIGLSVPMLRANVKHNIDILPREARQKLQSEPGAMAKKVEQMMYAPSKWLMWCVASLECSKHQLISTSTEHLQLCTRRNVAAFKIDMDAAGNWMGADPGATFALPSPGPGPRMLTLPAPACPTPKACLLPQ